MNAFVTYTASLGRAAAFMLLALFAVSSASAAPSMTIYFITGVVDDGGAENAGTATVFICSNLDGNSQQIGITIRARNGTTIVNNYPITLAPLTTLAAATHLQKAYFANNVFLTGAIKQGVAVIRATSKAIICSAMSINAGLSAPVGVELHMVRANEYPGLVE